MTCLRCNTEMNVLAESEDIQLGHHSFLFGDLSNLLSGSLGVKIYVCPKCKKLEFYYIDEN